LGIEFGDFLVAASFEFAEVQLTQRLHGFYRTPPGGGEYACRLPAALTGAGVNGRQWFAGQSPCGGVRLLDSTRREADIERAIAAPAGVGFGFWMAQQPQYRFGSGGPHNSTQRRKE